MAKLSKIDKIELLNLAVDSWIFSKIAGRIDDAKEKYPHLDIDLIAKNDPSGTNKYLLWMADQLNQGYSEENLYSIIKIFHKNQNRFDKKDIYTYNNLNELEDAIKNLPISEREKKQKLKQDIKAGGKSTIIFENDEYIVIRPDDKASCIILGDGTKWCITMQNEVHYERYIFDNVIFYFIIRKFPIGDNFDKVAIAYDRDLDNNILDFTMWNADDNEINNLNYLSNNLDNIILNKTEQDAKTYKSGIVTKILQEEASDSQFKEYWNNINFRTQLQLK